MRRSSSKHALRRRSVVSWEKCWVVTVLLCSSIFVVNSWWSWSNHKQLERLYCPQLSTSSKSIKAVHQNYAILANQVADLKSQLRNITEENHRTSSSSHGSAPRKTSTLHNPFDGIPYKSHFLFAGVLTTRGASDRRQAIRESYAKHQQPGVVVQFVLYEDEYAKELDQEFQEHQDLVFVPTGSDTGYRSIVYKTYFFVEWVVEHVDAKFILKTDDDTYVNIPLLLSELTSWCRDPECKDEALYMGKEKRKGEVIVEAGHKWANLEYKEHLDLQEYFPYMFGGGYIFSSDVARTLVQMQHTAGLKFMPNEDATFGFWVSGLNLRHVHHPKIKAATGNCNFNVFSQKDSNGRFSHLRVRSDEDLCAGWLLCHKVATAAQMEYIHYRLQQCSKENSILSTAKALAGDKRQRGQAYVSALQVYMLSNSSEGFHFYGDLPTSPWSSDGVRVLAHRLPHVGSSFLPVNLTDIQVKDELQVVVIDFVGAPGTRKHTSWRSTVVGRSKAWNYHYGSHSMWLGKSNRYIIYNDRDCHILEGGEKLYRGLCSVVVDVVDNKRVKSYRFPVVAVDNDGLFALSMDLTRVEEGMRGRGYARPANSLVTNFEANDGIWKLDLATGEAKLIVSYVQLYAAVTERAPGRKLDVFSGLRYPWVRAPPYDAMRACLHWLSPPRLNGRGTSLVFSYHITKCRKVGIRFSAAYLFTMNADGSRMWRVPLQLSKVFFYNYGPDSEIALCQNKDVYVIRNRANVTRLTKPDGLGHIVPNGCRFSPTNPRFLATDDWFNRKMVVWDLARKDALVVGQFLPDWQWWDAVRPQLLVSDHPTFSHNGQYLSFQSSFFGSTGMQMYVVGIQNLQVGTPDHSVPGQELALRNIKVFLDLSVRSGERLRWFMINTPDIHEYEIHAFESASLTEQQSQTLSATLKLGQVLARKVTLHYTAAGVADTVTTVNDEAWSSDDLSMDEFLCEIFNAGPLAQKRKWWQLRTRKQTSKKVGTNVVVPTTNFGAWMKANLEQDDYVVLGVDLGNSREFELLEAMLMDRSILLVDKLYIKWHYQQKTWHLGLLFEEVFTLLGIQFQYWD